MNTYNQHFTLTPVWNFYV